MSSERAGLYSVFPALFLYLYIGFSSIYVNGSITFLDGFYMMEVVPVGGFSILLSSIFNGLS